MANLLVARVIHREWRDDFAWARNEVLAVQVFRPSGSVRGPAIRPAANSTW